VRLVLRAGGGVLPVRIGSTDAPAIAGLSNVSTANRLRLLCDPRTGELDHAMAQISGEHMRQLAVELAESGT
jgi:hypothetical protein